MSPRIVVVDDDDGFRHVASLLLSARGFDVIATAADARSGLAEITRLQPDAALIDLNLPDGDGLSLARELAGLPHPPRVVLTSSEVLPAVLEAPAVAAFVRKEQLADVDLAGILGPATG